MVWVRWFWLCRYRYQASSHGWIRVYRIGSVSKLFTTISALQLVEQGRLELDRPLQQYVPDFSLRTRFGTAPSPTLRNIMTHHSGIPSDYLKGMWTPQPQPISTLPALIKDEYAAYPPNTVLSYSNLGMSLLGLAVQNVSGQEFAPPAAVAATAGMRRQAAQLPCRKPPQLLERIAAARRSRNRRCGHALAGGVNGSVRDMSRFVRMCESWPRVNWMASGSSSRKPSGKC